MGIDENLRLLETIMRYSTDVLCVIDPHGQFRRVSSASLPVLGYDGAELVGKSFADIIHPDDWAAVAACLSTHEPPGPVRFECRCLGKAGREVIVAWSVVQGPAAELRLCTGCDVTAQRQTAWQEERQQTVYRTAIEHGFDMVSTLDERGIYTYVGGQTAKVMGYQPEDLLGRHAFDFIHPEDLSRVQALWGQLQTLPSIFGASFRFRAANGAWRWIETSVCNELQNPGVRAFILSSRDVTGQKTKALALAESEQRFRVLFENKTSLAVFQDPEGRVVDINPAFLDFLKQPREAVMHRHLPDFLPADLRPTSAVTFREAMSGKTVRFEATFAGPEGREQRLSIIKIPLLVDEQSIGVYVAARDITEMATAQQLIKQQRQQLNTILESITDAFLSADNDWNMTYINQAAERMIGLRREQWLGKTLWDIFPEGRAVLYQQKAQQAVDSGKKVQFEAFAKTLGRWLELRMYPSKEGLSVYFSDITDRVEREKQLKMMALVAQGTVNAVIITDAEGYVEWVNAGFTKHTGYTQAEMLGKKPGRVLQGPETDPAAVQRFREHLHQPNPFSVTLLNYTKSGQKLWFAIDVTPLYNEAGELTQYMSIQQNINFQKEVEASQAQMTQDLYRHNRDLQQFTYVVSHNLRAPLANALGLAGLLTKLDKNGEVFATALANLQKSTRQADTVLKDLNLVLSVQDKPETPVQVRLAEVCQEVIYSLQDSLTRCGGRVKLDVAEGLEVNGNRAYFYSIFYNLLSNAIKYRSDERKLLVEIKCRTGEHDGACISFTDNGSGFDLLKAGSDVFQLYKRFHANQRGRGIGLFLVKAHVEAMGGQIAVASKVNGGTRFTLYLDQP